MPTTLEESKIARQKLVEQGVPESDITQFFGSAGAQQISQIAGGAKFSRPSTFDLPDVSPVTGTTPTFADLQATLAEGISSSVDFEQQIRENIERGRAATTGRIESEFGRAIGEARELGERERGVAVAQVTRFAGGLGTDTAAQGFIQGKVEASAKRVSDLEKKKQEALAIADINAINAINDSLREEGKLQRDLEKQSVDLFFKFRGEERAETQLDISTINALKGISEGQTVTIGGQTFTGLKRAEIKPFFTGSDMVSLMRTIPIGTTTDLTDPNTGEVFTITGLAQPKDNLKYIQSTDAQGNVTITTFDPADPEGTIKQVSAGRVGKGFKKSGAGDIDAGLDIVLGVDISELSSTQRTDLSEFLTDVRDFDNREEALTDLSLKSAEITARVGVTGLQVMVNEIDRQFPEEISQEDQKGIDLLTPEEALSGITNEQKLREQALEKATKAGQSGFIDPTTGEFVKI